MPTYTIPDQPTADVLWTRDAATGAPVEWTAVYDADERLLGWRPAGTADDPLDWMGLLGKGEVFDVYPDVAAWPTPWRYELDDCQITAADGTRVLDVDRHDRDAIELIVRAVNEWVADRSGSEFARAVAAALGVDQTVEGWADTALRKIEGLRHYHEADQKLLRERWGKSFRSSDSYEAARVAGALVAAAGGSITVTDAQMRTAAREVFVQDNHNGSRTWTVAEAKEPVG
jgi:hypothetical protein